MMESNTPISVVIITFNEEKNIIDTFLSVIVILRILFSFFYKVAEFLRFV